MGQFPILMKMGKREHRVGAGGPCTAGTPPGFVSLLLAVTSLGPNGSPGLEPAKGNLEHAVLWLGSPKWRGAEGRSVHSSSHSGAGL